MGKNISSSQMPCKHQCEIKMNLTWSIIAPGVILNDSSVHFILKKTVVFFYTDVVWTIQYCYRRDIVLANSAFILVQWLSARRLGPISGPIFKIQKTNKQTKKLYNKDVNLHHIFEFKLILVKGIVHPKMKIFRIFIFGWTIPLRTTFLVYIM